MIRIPLVSLALSAALAAATTPFQSFEGDGYGDWKVEGSAFGKAPADGKTESMESAVTGFSDRSLAISAHGGMDATGTLTSPEFTIQQPHIGFLIAGGNEAGKTAAQLVINGEVVREATGDRSLACARVHWDVSALRGENAQIRLLDDATGEWGFIAVDHIIFSDEPDVKFPPTAQSAPAVADGLIRTDVLPGATIPEGTSLKIEATHKDHQLTSPTAITFDDQGRIYVAETHRFRFGVEDDRDHLDWYLDDLAAKTTADRLAMFEKWKAKFTPDRFTAKSEIIRRLADTTGDGSLDESKVFADGFNEPLDGTAAGVFHYEGSLYFACIPKLIMLRDTNDDGTADERQVVAEGFGVRVSLSGHDMNGFAIGPDGRLYGTIGDRGMSIITKEGKTIDYPNEGAVFRFELDGSGFELFHTGLRNPKEIAFDALGNPVTVDNNSDQGDAARVVYLVEGGDSGWQMEHQAMFSFHRQIGLPDQPPSRWMDEKMWELQNPTQPAYILPPVAHLTSGPSGLTVHPGTGFLESEAGRFLICDYRGGAANSGVWSFEMKPKGAGMEMAAPRQLLWGVAATDVEYSWDGKLFVSDFVGGWTSHEDGRLLSLDAGDQLWNPTETAGAASIMISGFEQRSSAELAIFLKHPDARIRLRAQLALTRKKDALERLTATADSSDFTARVHAIWALGILARRGAAPLPFADFAAIPAAKDRTAAEEKLVALLQDPDAEIRCQVLRTLGEISQPQIPVQAAPMLTDDSPRVRFFAAMLVAKHQLIGNYGDICDMLEENANRDPYLRHAGVFALQHLANGDPRLLVGLVDHSSAAVRLAAVIALRRLHQPAIANFLDDPDPQVADEAIRAIGDNDMVAQRPKLAALLDNLGSRKWSPFMLRRLIHNAFRVGTTEDVTRVAKVAADAAMPEAVRREALRLLAEWAEPFPVDQLTGHWNPLPKRDAETIRPVLTAIVPDLLKENGYVLTAALGLVNKYNLQIASLDDATLHTQILDDSLPAEARINALTLYVARTPAELATFLTDLANAPADPLALAALENLARISPADAVKPLATAVTSGRPALIAKGWTILATLSDPAVDTMLVHALQKLSTAHGLQPDALELLAAARQREAPSVREALADFEKSLAETDDPLAKWNTVLEGGDPTAGAAIFASHPAAECSRCHRAEEGHSAGGETAPNLAGVAKRHPDRRYLLESLINPGAIITPGFGTVLVDFKNGASLAGNLIAESDTHLDIDTDGKLLRISRDDTTEVTAPTSPMPPMGELLSATEIRDVIAWLATLTTGGEASAAPTEPVAYQPEAPAAAVKSSAAIDPAMLKIGRQQFIICGACHGQDGLGTGIAPPLAHSEWVNGPEENLIRIQLRGLTGPITVNGQEYNLPAGMAPLAYQSDDQIAAVLTYIRSSFGNSAPPVTAAAVAALRSEVGKPQLTVADLIQPDPSAPATDEGSPASRDEDIYADLDESPPSVLLWVAAAVLLAIIFGFIFMKRTRRRP